MVTEPRRAPPRGSRSGARPPAWPGGPCSRPAARQPAWAPWYHRTLAQLWRERSCRGPSAVRGRSQCAETGNTSCAGSHYGRVVCVASRNRTPVPLQLVDAAICQPWRKPSACAGRSMCGLRHRDRGRRGPEPRPGREPRQARAPALNQRPVEVSSLNACGGGRTPIGRPAAATDVPGNHHENRHVLRPAAPRDRRSSSPSCSPNRRRTHDRCSWARLGPAAPPGRNPWRRGPRPRPSPCPASPPNSHAVDPETAIDGPPPPAPPAMIAREGGQATMRAIRLLAGIRVDGQLDEPVYDDRAPGVRLHPAASRRGRPRHRAHRGLGDVRRRELLRRRPLLGQRAAKRVGGDGDAPRRVQHAEQRPVRLPSSTRSTTGATRCSSTPTPPAGSSIRRLPTRAIRTATGTRCGT